MEISWRPDRTGIASAPLLPTAEPTPSIQRDAMPLMVGNQRRKMR